MANHSITTLVAEAKALLKRMADQKRNSAFSEEHWFFDVYRVHTTGRLLIRGIDRETYRETYRVYANLFLKRL